MVRDANGMAPESPSAAHTRAHKNCRPPPMRLAPGAPPAELHQVMVQSIGSIGKSFAHTQMSPGTYGPRERGHMPKGSAIGKCWPVVISMCCGNLVFQ